MILRCFQPQNYSCEFLGGQNHFLKLLSIAENINGELISAYDSKIDSVFDGVVADFAQDTRAVETARNEQKANFVTGVRSQFPTVIYNA